MFSDSAHNVAMIRHAMKLVLTVTSFTNPGQAPMLVCDQSLFVLAKQIYWTWPAEFGEDMFLIMFGGLHIEMTALAVAGKFLYGSGWTDSLVLAGVNSAGKAESLLRESKVKRSRYAHQVALACLSNLHV